MPLRVNGPGHGAVGTTAVPASGDSSPSSAAARASYTRPTPTAAPPRMVMDDVEPLGLDWARRAAQAVVAHSRFMEWVDRPKPVDAVAAAAVTGESPGTDHSSALGAYREFGASTDAA
jgi:hypothetical protein